MSIEAMYPSRNQSRSQNPLFARSMQRKRLALMLILTILGLGLLALQLFPVMAHADNTDVVKHAVEAKASAQPVKTIRQIAIYNVAAH